MSLREILVPAAMMFASAAHAQTLTVAAGQTIRVSTTEHDAYRAEMNFSWKPEIWRNEGWILSLHHALSVMTFRDKNTVNAVSWAPNLVLSSGRTTGIYPWIQLGFGVAYLSDDKFESEPRTDTRYPQEGTTDMGSQGQFESSFAIGLSRDSFSIRAKVYHYSNAELAKANNGIDVAEFGISYSF